MIIIKKAKLRDLSHEDREIWKRHYCNEMKNRIVSFVDRVEFIKNQFTENQIRGRF